MRQKCKCCGRPLLKTNTSDAVFSWLRTSPKIVKPGASAKTNEVLDAFNKWCLSQGRTPVNAVEFGIMLSREMPELRTKQIQKDRARYRAYIFPKDKPVTAVLKPSPNNLDDLLDI